jgi:hypothetical protein
MVTVVMNSHFFDWRLIGLHASFLQHRSWNLTESGAPLPETPARASPQPDFV